MGDESLSFFPNTLFSRVLFLFIFVLQVKYSFNLCNVVSEPSCK